MFKDSKNLRFQDGQWRPRRPPGGVQRRFGGCSGGAAEVQRRFGGCSGGAAEVQRRFGSAADGVRMVDLKEMPIYMDSKSIAQCFQ